MRAFVALTWLELKLFVREPLTVVFVLVLPLVMLFVLYGVFGDAPASTQVWEGLDAVDFYTPSYVALVVATAGVLSLPVHLAAYREEGVLRRFRASAVRPGTLVAAHMATSTVTATAGAVLLSATAIGVYDAPAPRHWPGVLLAYALVAAVFAGLGSLLGLLMPGARSAQGLGVLLFFVFLMLGGAGPPREVLPTVLARIGDALPVTPAARLLRGPWLARGWDVDAALVLLALLVVCLAGVGRLLRAADRR